MPVQIVHNLLRANFGKQGFYGSFLESYFDEKREP